MADLEEKFLKKNIPGKYSTWGDEYNDKPRTDDSDDDGDDHDNEHDIPQEQESVASIPSTQQQRQGPNTGPKGVREDHRQAKQLEKLKIAQEQMDRKDAFRQATEAAVMKPGEKSISISSMMQERKRLEQQQSNENDHDHDHDCDCDDSDSDSFDDDEFLDSYRQKRLSQMQQLTSFPTFGSVTQVESAIHFTDLIDETDQRVYCVFHLYNVSIPCCRMMNEHFEHLARDMSYCRFFRLEASYDGMFPSDNPDNHFHSSSPSILLRS